MFFFLFASSFIIIHETAQHAKTFNFNWKCSNLYTLESRVCITGCVRKSAYMHSLKRLQFKLCEWHRLSSSVHSFLLYLKRKESIYVCVFMCATNVYSTSKCRRYERERERFTLFISQVTYKRERVLAKQWYRFGEICSSRVVPLLKSNRLLDSKLGANLQHSHNSWKLSVRWIKVSEYPVLNWMYHFFLNGQKKLTSKKRCTHYNLTLLKWFGWYEDKNP